MLFSDLLSAGAFPVALEITPPQKPAAQILLRRAQLLADSAAAINVIQRRGRISSLDASLALLEAGIQPAWHLVTRGVSRETIAAEIERAVQAGIRQVLVIRGDDGGNDTPDTPTIREVTAMLRDRDPDVSIGATFNHYAKDPHAALRNLGGKLRAGASYVQTQPVFDAAAFLPVAERLRALSPETRIVPMVMPLVAPGAGDRIGQRLRIATPWQPDGEDACWEAFGETLAKLRESGLVDGVALMTFEMDPPPETGARILAALRTAGVAKAGECGGASPAGD